MSQTTENPVSISISNLVLSSRTQKFVAELHDYQNYPDRALNLEVRLDKIPSLDEPKRSRDVIVDLNMSGRFDVDAEFTRFGSLHLVQRLELGPSGSETNELKAQLISVTWLIVRPILQDAIIKMGITDLHLPVGITADFDD